MGLFDLFKKNKDIHNDNGLNEIYYDNGKGNIKSRFYKKNRMKNGSSKFFHKNGNISLEVNWKNGNHDDGPWKEYSSNGQIWKEGNIFNGKRNGTWKEYYKNGQIQKHGNLNNGKKDGLWKFFSQNGNLDYEINYREEKPHGLWKFFQENKLSMSQDWENGKTVGNSKSYYDNGQLKSEGFIKLPENNMLSLEELEGSTLLGDEFTWLDNSEQDGVWKFYSINGKLNSEVKYNEGKIISEKCWSEDGNEIECKD